MKYMTVLSALLVLGLALTMPAQAEIRYLLWTEDFDSYDPCNPNDPFTNPLLDGTWSEVNAPIIKLFDDPCDPCQLDLEAFYNDANGEGGTPIDDPNRFFNSFSQGNYRLAVSREDTVGTNVAAYAYKDVTGLHNGQADMIELEFDLLANFKWASYEGKHIHIQFVSDTDQVIASLLLRSHSSGWYQLNGEDIPTPPWWTPWAFDHYRMAVDFLRDRVSIYINDETEPRLITELAEDYSTDRLAGLRFGAGVYYRAAVFGFCILDNLELSEVYLCPPGDVYVDCATNIQDLTQLASDWLESGL